MGVLKDMKLFLATTYDSLPTLFRLRDRPLGETA